MAGAGISARADTGQDQGGAATRVGGRGECAYKRLSVEQYAKIITVRRANPKATQEEVAREAGVSRPTVSRVTRGHNRRPRVSPVV
jgi:hypothetical protein